jgi:outer membrane protein assembly factor BamB
MRFTVLCAFSVLVSFASDWTRYRGPDGTGISSGHDLPVEIGSGRNVIWKTKTFKGNSSPIVLKNRLWITGHDGDERFLLCYDTVDGRLLWRQGVTKARTEALNPLNGPTTPSPATDGRSVFVFFPDFGLLAYGLDGKEQWRVPLGPFGHIQGMAVSPIYAEGNVVLLIDTPETAYLAAFDSRTGRQSWKVDRPIGFLGSYATPSVYRPRGRPAQIVVSGAVELTGYQATTGERLWWARGVTYAPAALPLVSGDSVYTVEPTGEPAPPFSHMLNEFDRDKNGKIQLSEVGGDSVNQRIMHQLFKSIDKNVGDGDDTVTEREFSASFNPDPPAGGLVRFRLNGTGDVSKTHVQWRHAKGLPYVTSPLLYDKVLYVVRNGGILSTFEPDTGKLLREERLKDALGEYYASPVGGDGKVYFINKEGKTTTISAGTAWKVLSSGDLAEQVIATPAIADGRIYVRTEGTLYSFGLKAP